MIRSRQDYVFIQQSRLRHISITGKPYPARIQRLIRMGEDEAFMEEAIAERNCILGNGSPVDPQEDVKDGPSIHIQGDFAIPLGGSNATYLDRKKVEQIEGELTVSDSHDGEVPDETKSEQLHMLNEMDTRLDEELRELRESQAEELKEKKEEENKRKDNIHKTHSDEQYDAMIAFETGTREENAKYAEKSQKEDEEHGKGIRAAGGDIGKLVEEEKRHVGVCLENEHEHYAKLAELNAKYDSDRIESDSKRDKGIEESDKRISDLKKKQKEEYDKKAAEAHEQSMAQHYEIKRNWAPTDLTVYNLEYEKRLKKFQKAMLKPCEWKLDRIFPVPSLQLAMSRYADLERMDCAFLHNFEIFRAPFTITRGYPDQEDTVRYFDEGDNSELAEDWSKVDQKAWSSYSSTDYYLYFGNAWTTANRSLIDRIEADVFVTTLELTKRMQRVLKRLTFKFDSLNASVEIMEIDGIEAERRRQIASINESRRESVRKEEEKRDKDTFEAAKVRDKGIKAADEERAEGDAAARAACTASVKFAEDNLAIRDAKLIADKQRILDRIRSAVSSAIYDMYDRISRNRTAFERNSEEIRKDYSDKVRYIDDAYSKAISKISKDTNDRIDAVNEQMNKRVQKVYDDLADKKKQVRDAKTAAYRMAAEDASAKSAAAREEFNAAIAGMPPHRIEVDPRTGERTFIFDPPIPQREAEMWIEKYIAAEGIYDEKERKISSDLRHAEIRADRACWDDIQKYDTIRPNGRMRFRCTVPPDASFSPSKTTQYVSCSGFDNVVIYFTPRTKTGVDFSEYYKDEDDEET